MKYQEAKILNELESRVRKMMWEKLPDSYFFHNLQHTLDVVKASKIIGEAIELGHREHFVVQLAAWLHDLGYIYSGKGHEKESANLAVILLVGLDLEDAIIEEVVSCILATEDPRNPSAVTEQVLLINFYTIPPKQNPPSNKDLYISFAYFVVPY